MRRTARTTRTTATTVTAAASTVETICTGPMYPNLPYSPVTYGIAACRAALGGVTPDSRYPHRVDIWWG
jgi:hypothetical protein